MEILKLITSHPAISLLIAAAAAVLYYRARYQAARSKAAILSSEKTLREIIMQKEGAEKDAQEAEDAYKRYRDEYFNSRSSDGDGEEK